MSRKLASFAAMAVMGTISFNVHAEEPTKIQQLRQVINDSSISNKQEILANADNMEASEQQQYLQRKVDALRGLSASAISYDERNPGALKEIRAQQENDVFSNITNLFSNKDEAPKAAIKAPIASNDVPNSSEQNIDAFSAAVADNASLDAPQEIAQIEPQQIIRSKNPQNSPSSRSLAELRTAYAEKHPGRAATLQDEFNGVSESEQVAILSRQLGLDAKQDG